MKTIIMPETNIQEQPGPGGLPIFGISDSTQGGTLKESEDNFRTFVETIDDMVIVATREGRILFTNKSFKRKLGYSDGELAAMHVLDVHPSDKRKEAEEIFAAMFRGDRESCPLPLARKDGSLIPVETRAWFGKWNDSECIFGISKDLTNEHEALQKFNRLFISNPAPMAVSSLPDRRFTDVNDAFLNTTGYSLKEVIGKTPAELGLTPNPERQAEVAGELLTNEHIANFELQVRRKDGIILNGLFSGEVIVSQGKKHFLTVMIDQTERKRAEEALKDNEELLRQVLENSQDSSYKRNLQTDSYDYMSPVFFKISGYTPDEMKYLPQETLMDLIHPEDLAEIQSVIAESLSNSDNKKFQMEYRFKHKDGKYRWLQDRFTVMRDGKGQPLAIIGIVRDITEHKKTEEALQESEEKYRGIFDESIAAVYVFDNEKNFINTNQAGLDLLGYSRQELLHMSISDVDADPVVVLPVQQEVLSGKRLINYEHRLRRKDGTIFAVLNNSRPIKNTQGNVVGMFSIMMDITERKQAEEDLKKSEIKYNTLFHKASIPIAILQPPHYIFIDVNDAWLELFGYTRDDVLGKNSIELGINRDYSERAEMIEEVQSHDHIVKREQTLFTKSGDPITVLTNISEVEIGDSTCLFNSVQDITPRKLLKDELKRTNNILAEAQKIAHLGSFEYVAATRSTVWSEEEYRIFGLDPAGPSPEYGVMLQKFIHPDDAASLNEDFMKAVQNQAAYEHEHRIVRLDGSVRWVFSSAHPYFDEQGGLARYIGTALDITERKEAELALIKEQAFLERVMETVPTGVLIFDTNGKISHANSQAELILGFSQDEIKKQPYNDPAWKKTDLNGNYFPVEELPFSRVVSRRMPVYDVQYAIEWPDGKRVFLSVNAAPLLNNEGNLEGVVEAITDITDLKQAEKSIHAFSRKLLNVREHERRQISTALHHDLGSITVGVTSRLQAAKDDIRASRFRKALQALEDGESIFTEAIRHLKKLAIELRPPDLDLLGLQRALRQYFAQVSKGTSRKIYFSDTSRGIAIPTDIQTIIFRIAQECLNNIIQHADAMHARVRLSASKGVLKLSFTDDGRGFNPESLVTNTDNHLGILTMHEMVKDSGGEIKIESTLGKGTKISIMVPLNIQSEAREVTQ